MPTTPIDILTKQSCSKNKPPSSVRILFSFSNPESMENTEEKNNKKQSTRIINAKHKNQNLKVLFSNPLYTQFLSVFFFSLLIFRLTISPRWVYLSMFYVWAAEFSNVSQLATESQPKLLFHTHKNYMMFRHCYSNIDNGRVIINKFLMFDKYLGEREKENEFFLETMQSDTMCECVFFSCIHTYKYQHPFNWWQ